MRRTLVFALSAVFIIALVELGITSACNSSTPQPSGQGQARAAAKATQAPLNLAISLDPPQPLDGKPFTVRLRVTDQLGKPVADATVHGSLTMSTMDMGKNEFDFRSQGDGNYEATATANMAGPWELKVQAKKGADVGEQVSSLVVKE